MTDKKTINKIEKKLHKIKEKKAITIDSKKLRNSISTRNFA